MSPVLKNFLAVIAGLIVGSFVNMALISISGAIIPPPNGADVTTAEGLKATMHLFEPKHFIFPFLAHAAGTLAGAFLTALLAVNNKVRLALIIGFFFLAGGLASVFMLPSPTLFTVLDLVVAYIPMAYLGARLAPRKNKPVYN